MKLLRKIKVIHEKGVPTSKEIVVTGSDAALDVHYHKWARSMGEMMRTAEQDRKMRGPDPELPATYFIRARWTNTDCFIEIMDIWVAKWRTKRDYRWIRFFGGEKTENKDLAKLLEDSGDCNELFSFIENLEGQGVVPRLAKQGPSVLEECGSDLHDDAPSIDHRRT